MSVRPYNPRRRRAFNPATKKLFEYGLIGLAIGAVLIAGLQLRPSSVFPSSGTLQIELTSGIPVAQVVIQSSMQSKPPSNCHSNCTATSLNVTITSIEVHTSGIDNMTGEWKSVCTEKVPMTVDLIKVENVTRLLCGENLPPDSITNVRLSVSSAVAYIPGAGVETLNIPSGKLEIPINPLASIQAGKTTKIFVEFQPHIVEQGNGVYKMTPVLHAITSGPS